MEKAATTMMYDQELEEVKGILEQGGTILFPTDTIWSLGCDATNSVAVKKLLSLKGNEASAFFTVLVDSSNMIKKYVGHLHPKIETLLAYHRRPLTVVYDAAKNLPDNVIAADGSVAIRIPQDEYCRYLIRSFGKPIVVTTANIDSGVLPESFEDIEEQLKKKADFISSRRRKEAFSDGLAVMVRLSPRAELVFLRE
ncbi:MAG: Sua5/YciO/YrdC/YwlC family protein [Bacteroidota bacterium]